MKILSKLANLLFCTVSVESKITRQPHRDAHIPSDILGYCIHVDVRGGANTYVTWKSYWYFMLLVDDTTHITWIRFMKKKSDVLSVFREFVIMLERHYNIRVCVIHIDFGEFNSDVATDYFSHTGIFWEPSAPNAQQQNGIVKRHMRTVVKGARVQMVDANLLIKLWAESISILVYIKNRSPSAVVYEGTMTPIQDFYRGNQPNVDHIRIFGSETYVFDESYSKPGLISKAWKGFLVGYDARNQYHIYDPIRNTVYVRRDVRFNEQVISPPKPIINYDNSLQEKNTENTAQLFPLLPVETKQITRFTPADKNLPLHPTFSAPAPANLNPARKPSALLAILHLPTISLGTASAKTLPSTPIQVAPISQTPPPTPPQAVPASETLVLASNQNFVPGICENFDDNLSDVLLSDDNNDREQNAPRQSACIGANQVDYKKYFQRGKATTTKTNLSVPIGSPYSKASQILFDYALNQPEQQATHSFVRVA